MENVAPDALGGGGGERDDRHLRVLLLEEAELLVVGPKVVAPLADAMHLVDDEPGELAGPVEGLEAVGEFGRERQLLGGDVEELEVGPGLVELAVDVANLLFGEIARQVHSADLRGEKREDIERLVVESRVVQFYGCVWCWRGMVFADLFWKRGER